ncbi:MAG TPA: AI-2E family transporter, partial [Myxococcota bacterium]|nr:AI-2E family transporter [Myxococcota bacterium]
MSRSREVPETVRRRFILGLLFVVTLGFLGMIQDFLVALLLAGLFAGLLHPLHRRASRSLGGHSAVAAVATIVASLFLVGLPVAGFGALVTAEALQLSEQVVPRMQSLLEEDARLASLLPDWLPYDERLAETLEPYRANAVRSLANATSTAGRWLVSGVSDLTQGTLRLALGFFVMIYAIFFFLLEGPALLRSLGSLLPLDPADRQLVLDRG